MVAAWVLLAAASADVVIARKSAWSFQKGTAEASTPIDAWRGSGFSAAHWPVAPAPFHYGEASVTGGTRLTDMLNGYGCVFARHDFALPNLETLGSLTVTAWSDDGFVAWMNGVEIARYRVNPGTVTINSLANSSAPEPIAPVSYTFTALGGLRPTGNVLAIQAFNRARNNGDFQFDAELTSAIRDDTPPRILGVTPAPGPVGALASCAVRFSEAVSGVEEEDLQINGLPCERVTGGGDTYTFFFRQPAYGPVRVAWIGAHGITDLAQPPNPLDLAGFATWTYALSDGVPPEALETHPADGAAVGVLAQVEVTFTEAVTGIDGSDLLVNGEPASTVRGFGAGPYVFGFAPVPDGEVRFEWAPGHGIRDFGSPPNPLVGASWTAAVNSSAPTPAVSLTEFCASNVSGLKDEDGEAQDWIEVANAGAAPVDLAGWALTDDPDWPGQWVFPSIILSAGQRLVVFASGKNRRDTGPGTRLHANFRLAGDGEYLGLFNGDSPRRPITEFRPRYPDQRNDHSYGIATGGLWRYFATPTPGAPNGPSSLTGVVAHVAFSAPRGWRAEPFDLTLSTATETGVIRYTTDGSVPTLANGTTYAGPIPIATTTVVRAAAFKPDSLPSRVATQTYLFAEAILRQPAQPAGFPVNWGSSQITTGDYAMDARVVDDPAYATRIRDGLGALPALCLTMSVDDWFNPARGIYSNGDREGMAWERAGSVEYLPPDGADFQENCGIRVQGGTSTAPWKSYKLSLRTTFRGDYGPKRLDYALFPDSAVERFNTLVLDAGLNYVWSYGGTVTSDEQRRRAKYVGDQFTSDLQLRAGALAVHGRFVHLFVNGLYWGLYNTHEEPEAAFGADWLGGEKADYDVIKHTGDNAIDGNTAAWEAMMQAARAGAATPTGYAALGQMLDLPGLADYMVIHFYVGNTDWPHHNWYALRRRVPDAKWRFVSWDSEHVLKSVNEDRTAVNNANSPAELYSLLRANPEFRLLFADRAHRHFFNGGILHVNPARPTWDPTQPQNNRPAAIYEARVAEIDLALIAESARWGDNQRPAQPYTRNVEYQAELSWLRTQYFPQRSAIVLNQLRSAGLYPGVAAPAFSQHGGWAPPGFALTVSAPAGTVYYTLDGGDPRVPGSGAIASGARVSVPGQPVPLERTTWVKARALLGGSWSALNEARFEVAETANPLRLTEIMYDSGAGDAHDFVELLNTASAPLDVSGWSLAGVRYVFPPGTVLQPGQVVVLCADVDPLAFAQAHPGVTVDGQFAGSLADSGETLALVDAAGATRWSLTYRVEPPWPNAQGNGHSLEVIDPAGEPGDPGNWRSSDGPGGTPGTQSRPLAAIVRLNEILAVPEARATILPPAPDWIELHNTAAVPISLAGWSLSDGADARRFVFPAEAVLPASGYRVVYADHATNGPDWHAGFALEREGQTVALYDDRTNRVDAFTYGWQLAGFSVGRDHNAEWTLNRPSPGEPNTTHPTGELGQLVINEWLANPPPGDEDWIELHNRHPLAAVDLLGLEVVTASARARFGYHAFIAPGGFLRLWVTGRSTLDALALKLPAAGGFIELQTPQGLPIDRVNYPPQPEGSSMGRLPDVTGTPRLLKALTPGQPNADSPEATDWDGDGLPDAWETAHGLDPRRAGGQNGASGDPDEDGTSNATEFAAGTDPKSPGSRLALAVDRVTAEGAWLVVPGVTGRAYLIEATSDPTALTWELVLEIPGVSVAGSIGVVAPVAADGPRFYRIRLR